MYNAERRKSTKNIVMVQCQTKNRLDCIVLRYLCAYPQLQTVCDVFAFYFVSYYSVLYTREEFNFVILLFCESKNRKENSLFLTK